MLKKQNRLVTKYEFNKTRRLGKKVESKNFYLYFLEAHGNSRVGIVVSNKFSKIAPQRNRVKRVFREAIRQNFDKIKPGYWIVIHPKKASENIGYEEISSEFTNVLQDLPISR